VTSSDVLALALEEQLRARAIVAGLGDCLVVLSNARSTLGSFSVDRHNGSTEIRISRHLADVEQVRETARHELAHQVAWERYQDLGHGAFWQTMASYLGCEPVACVRVDRASVATHDRYAITCKSCGWSTTRARRSKLVTKPWRFGCAECGAALRVGLLPAT
jgi:predicted SprT family Zn-dependent metalloprotease